MQTKAAVDPSNTQEGSLGAAQAFLAGADPTSPPAAILDADLRGLPPLLVQVGSHETLLDDSLRLVVRAAHHDVEVSLQVWPEQPHVFHFFYPILKEGRDAIGQAAAFIARHTGASVQP